MGKRRKGGRESARVERCEGGRPRIDGLTEQDDDEGNYDEDENESSGKEEYSHAEDERIMLGVNKYHKADILAQHHHDFNL